MEKNKVKKEIKTKEVKKVKVKKLQNTKITDVEIKRVPKGGIIDKIKQYFKENDLIIINMEMDNGDKRTFSIINNEKTFVYQDRAYIIDEKLKYYNSSLKSYCLDYHRSISVPLKNNYDALSITEAVGALDDEVITSLNPIVLKQALEAKVVRDVVSGSSLEEIFKFLKLMLIITTVVSVIHLFLFLKASGMLDSINLPF